MTFSIGPVSVLQDLLVAQYPRHRDPPDVTAVLNDGPDPPAFPFEVAQCGAPPVVTGFTSLRPFCMALARNFGQGLSGA